MIDILMPHQTDWTGQLKPMTYQQVKGTNGHHTNQQYKTHAKVEYEYVSYPPNPLGRFPVNILTEEILTLENNTIFLNTK